ncbi:phenylacetate-CoA oxygenase subunit PaaC [Microvirga tunisiensis]|uniref:Phenylacetate-CoA oxygenase subunit PaaC n=2 Tax=Pannonibacter tanglangensis TaxID=2750084 RepID=A0ABW9ZBU7_9HYPH|nr:MULTISPECIES: 1,2-phenylacetyl-CoA epoxidase subunit PaaC [unclassified Pannonibacter]NBN62292.1 phenylacetate-CoA oxygenase subunit PaaC [Pannonibacter sp. XCT-34]NBN77959.1 phenylacetate-CoA oxygenase subunit PaaC [Pannonibacter sp. XCT-53]
MGDLPLTDLCLRMGDTCLILAQRTSEWVGHAPILEEDIGLANIALDLVGQTQLWLGLAAELEGKGRSADDLAYRRDQGAFRNLLIAELPNGDFGRTLMRQYLVDAWHYPMLKALATSPEPRIAEIAEKALKEVSYHLARSADLVISLGDGTPESHARMQAALDDLWAYTGEMLTADDIDTALAEAGVGPDLAAIATAWHAHVDETLARATLDKPASGYMHKGGKHGRHSEHLGYILAEMQFLQRAYPGATW